MRILIEDKRSVVYTPNVGDAWTHTDYSNQYLRIEQERGRIACGHTYTLADKYFYSLNLTHGTIVYHLKIPKHNTMERIQLIGTGDNGEILLRRKGKV